MTSTRKNKLLHVLIRHFVFYCGFFSSIFHPLIPHAPQTVFVWLILNSLLDLNSLIDLFVMLHLLFGTNCPPPFVPSPQKQLMPTQWHFHYLPYLINSISRHIFSLSPFLPRLLLSPLPIPCNFIECPRIYQTQLV